MRLTPFLFSLEGRTGRESYWLFVAGCLTLSLIVQGLLPPLAEILWLILLWPVAAVIVKRYHDQDRSGAWALVHFFVPPLGIYQCGFIAGTRGSNKFGPETLVDPLTDNSTRTRFKKVLCLLASVALFLFGLFFLATLLMDILTGMVKLDFAEKVWSLLLGVAAWSAAYFYLRRGLIRRLTPGGTDGP